MAQIDEAKSVILHNLNFLDYRVPSNSSIVRSRVSRVLLEGGIVSIVGSTGNGKTALIKSVLKEVTKLYKYEFREIILYGHVGEKPLTSRKDAQCWLLSELKGKTITYSNEVESRLRKYWETHPNLHVVFILDQFHVFATARQTFLYSILELMDFKPTHLCLVAISTRLVCNKLPLILDNERATFFRKN
eukprot:TRINITY_DN14772_c0_g1_i1.p1 TRINITY_DN14772_c0_g1~~TRINITY_DN14772_c0_g1_i1.p1  ORF type:complete len:189 (-),score=19.06 TRINITY_DN14772_c0_g1_i1:8-574(-)